MQTHRRLPSTHPRGFTLIEIMIVIAIVLALMGVIGVAVFGQRDKAKASIAEMDLGRVKDALNNFNLDFGRYPTDEEGLEVLWNKEKLSSDSDATKWTKYLTGEVSKDRWSNAIGYRQKSEHGDETTFDLWSNGPDGEEGTADDITSWKKDGSTTGGASTSGGEEPPRRSGGG